MARDLEQFSWIMYMNGAGCTFLEEMKITNYFMLKLFILNFYFNLLTTEIMIKYKYTL